jgi:hypothetical protein
MIRGALRTLFVAGFTSAALLVALWAAVGAIHREIGEYQDGMMYE